MNSKKNIVKTGNKAYTEVKLDGMGDGRSSHISNDERLSG